MFRFFCLSVLGMAVATAFGGANFFIAPEKFEGKVFAVNEQSLTVGTDEEQRAFVITKETRITLDGNPVRWSDLKFGFSATVLAMPSDDLQWIAHEVAAYANE